MSSRKSSGFTIVELLVVITIIVILMGLLFPAINAARESARKANCISNEGQVGKAVLTYTTRKGNFPKHLNFKGPNGTAPQWPWAANIMTELGRGDIAEAMITDNNPASRAELIEVLICPSDPPVGTTSKQISYVANAGLETTFNDPANAKIAEGVFQRTKDVSLGYVAQNDGTSTTLMLSENIDATDWTANSPTAAQESAIVWYDAEPAGCGLNVNTSCAGNQLARPRSNHSGGFVVTFCDGHTEFLSQEIGYNVYKLIMTPDGSSATTQQLTVLNEADLQK